MEQIKLTSTVFNEKFYITTAINYTNGYPHIGHAYEAITSDIIARYHRIFGRDTYFLTGTDEHGQKIAQAAAANNISPIELCNKFCNEFKNLNQRLNISNDYFVRTSEKDHYDVAQQLFQKCLDNGDIYLGTYSGWYNVREETFITENEAKITDYKDVVTGNLLTKMEEASYFFRLSKYQMQLIEYIKNNESFIQPSHQREFILNRLNNEELHDLSISRTTFDWGIPIPSDPSHVLYVWFDALTNYLTGIDWLKSSDKIHYWPPNVQIIGKDILWFHCVIWPAMLMSAGIELPKTIFGHGFVHDEHGYKMSKSVGNIINPNDILNKYSSDSFRLSLINQNPFGNDMNFSQERLISIHNADLADTIGNLVHRCGVIISRNSNGVVPDVEPIEIINFAELKKDIEQYFSMFNLHSGYEKIISSVKLINTYLTQSAPWKINDSDDPSFTKRNIILRSCLEAIYIIAHFLFPFIPDTANKIFTTLSTLPVAISSITSCKNLKSGISIGKFEFRKIELQSEKLKNIIINKNTSELDQHIFTKLDIRVGCVTKVWIHPSSTKLYCEEIDIGEDQPRQIASGLQQKISIDEFQGKKVLVICNLKEVKLAGFASNGMVLCVNNDENVELLCPNDSSKIGERIMLEGISGEPVTANQVKNKKILEQVISQLKTNSDGIACFNNLPLMTSVGTCKACSLVNANIA